MRLADTVALVTGGGSGIGRAICERFAREGAVVVAADRYLDRAEETARLIANAGGTALGVEADVATSDAVTAMADRVHAEYGRVDVLVNNAGISMADDILTYDETTWDLQFDVVLKSVFLCSKAVLPGMLERQRGVIINIASVNGLLGMGKEAYSAAKAGMINFTRNMAMKYGDRNVRVNCIAPGTIRTRIWEERIAADPRIFERLSRWYPLGRIGAPEDVANAALFLASDEAAWVTGVMLPVDGGLSAGPLQMMRDFQGTGERA